MKVLLSLDGGAIQLQEQAGVFTLVFDASLTVGGGAAAGILKVQGAGTVVLSGAQALVLGEALLNSHLPAAVLPVAEAVEGIVNAEVGSL
jgi:hypothetical protein